MCVEVLFDFTKNNTETESYTLLKKYLPVLGDPFTEIV